MFSPFEGGIYVLIVLLVVVEVRHHSRGML